MLANMDGIRSLIEKTAIANPYTIRSLSGELSRLARKGGGVGLLFLLLYSCVYLETPKKTVPIQKVPAPMSAGTKRLVIVLPGRGDDLSDLQQSGIASTIQKQLSDADVWLIELTFPYYMEGRAPQRVHEQIVQPAKRAGYREIYLAGASMGGMGVLLYEREYPDQASGLILMAPYMGDEELIEEITAAGGLAKWQAGPKPKKIDSDNVGREEWRLIQSWKADNQRTRQVWLICGKSDRFHGAVKFIAPLLPPGHTVEPDGGHAWSVWTKGAEKVFSQINARRPETL